jgi:hypothetical protein
VPPPILIPIVLESSLPAPLNEWIISYAEAKSARALTYGDEVGNAVESSVNQVSGDGQEKFSWLEFDVLLLVNLDPVSNARELARFRQVLDACTGIRIDELHFAVTRARMASRQRLVRGYRLGLRFIGPNNDFVDASGASIPLF